MLQKGTSLVTIKQDRINVLTVNNLPIFLGMTCVALYRIINTACWNRFMFWVLTGCVSYLHFYPGMNQVSNSVTVFLKTCLYLVYSRFLRRVVSVRLIHVIHSILCLRVFWCSVEGSCCRSATRGSNSWVWRWSVLWLKKKIFLCCDWFSIMYQRQRLSIIF